MALLPESVLQFGTGKFLRGFADLFIEEANRERQNVGRVVVVQTTGDDRANLLNRQGGRYHVLVRGLENGAVVDRVEEVRSISRALVATTQWEDVLAVARAPQLRFIISNTAEAGYTLDPADRAGDRPPRSFPAKLLLVLKERFEAGRPGVMVLPCELFEHNADLLLGLLTRLAESWGLSRELADWLRSQCVWPNTLVDRIVSLHTTTPHALVGQDPLLTVAEPFALWAVETKGGRDEFFRHTAIHRASDIQPFFLRKVRILNAAHTALATKAIPRGITTVREAVTDPEIAAWLDRLLFEEIVPVLRGMVEVPEEFARQTLERFRNPFLEHRIADILTYHNAKVQIRLVPTCAEYAEKFGRAPPLLEEAIAASAALGRKT